MSKWKNESALLSRFLGAGLLNTLVGFSVIFVLMTFDIDPVLANISGYFVGFLLGFVASKKFVFRSHRHFVAESIRYLLAFFIAFGLNFLVLYLLLYYLRFNAVFAQICAAVSYSVLMFTLMRFFVFKPKLV